MRSEPYAVYIMTNPRRTVLYTGVTGRLAERVYQHKSKQVAGFTSKYNIANLVHYELCDDIRSAIEREKQIKGWTRKKKISLIMKSNPSWRDLSENL